MMRCSHQQTSSVKPVNAPQKDLLKASLRGGLWLQASYETGRKRQLAVLHSILLHVQLGCGCI